MRQNISPPSLVSEMTKGFSDAVLPFRQETLGQITVEILYLGGTLNRKVVCTSWLRRLDAAFCTEEECYYQELIGTLFDR